MTWQGSLFFFLLVCVSLGAVGLVVMRRSEDAQVTASSTSAPGRIVEAAVPLRQVVPLDVARENAARDAEVDSPRAVEPDASTWCAELEAENVERLARLQQRVDAAGCPVVAPDVSCVSGHGLAWAYRVVGASAKTEGSLRDPPDPMQCSSMARVELVRRDGQGTKVVTGGGEVLAYDWTTKKNSVALALLSDYDGDGERELLRVREQLFQEGTLERRAEVMTFTSGVVSPYRPAKGIDVDHAEDIDEDGRLDLVSAGPYASVFVTDGMGNRIRILPAILAWHADSDGTFSLTHPTSVAFTKKACTSRRAVVFTPSDLAQIEPDDLARDVLCQALWGGGRAIEAAWDRACVSFDATDDPYACKDWPNQVAAVRPPFVLK